jgi:Zn-dependent peptidase ImmA (M78 family)
VFDRDEALFLDFEGAAVTVDLQERQDSKAERNANQFAADLLMPKSLLQRDVSEHGLDVTLLAKRYGVSPQALWFRLLNLGLVADSL